jgi:hypothetical protein
MLATLALLAVVHIAPAADSVAGAWKISGDVMGNAFGAMCTIKQAEAVLSGSCVDDGGVARPMTGEVKDGKITFKYASDYQGQPLTIAYTGTLVSSPRQLKGSVDVQPMGVGGTFTGTPAPAAP